MPDNLLIFSGGLLVVILCVVLVLLRLRYTGEQSSSSIFETRRLYFAGVVLTGLGIIFLESMAMYFWGTQGKGTDEDVGKNIFDACKTIIPPIATLVLGFYFGKSDNHGQSAPPIDRNIDQLQE
jgi:hypothetical protein